MHFETAPFYCKSLDKLPLEELTVDSLKWTVKVSTAWILFKIIDEVDTSTVNCQLSTVHCGDFNLACMVVLVWGILG